MARVNYFAYTRNDGTTIYSIRHREDLASTAGTGFGAADATHPAPPKGFRSRVVHLLDAADGRRRSLVVGTPAAYAALTAGGQTLSLFELGAAAASTWNVTGGRDEVIRAPHLIH